MPLYTVDFETEGIESRPVYPPVPCGVAVRDAAGRSKYWAWGHPTENNCTRAEAVKYLKSIWREDLLFHNAAFDIEVAVKHLGLPPPSLDRWEDTLILAYLFDPRANSLSLKPMADLHLDMPPDEQTELKEWIIENYMKPNGLRKYSQWGAYICKAPGKLVGKYARGDVIRTFRLKKFFERDVRESGMWPAYEREKKLIYIKLNMENAGIRLSPRIKKDFGKWVRAQEDVDRRIRKILRVDDSVNINSGPQLANALIDRDLLSVIEETPTGKPSTKRAVLEKNCTDKKLVQLLGFNSILKNYVGTFLTPWKQALENNDGFIYPSFNTVRSTDEYGKGGVGTRTGRFSSSNPNFENIPADVEESQHREILLALKHFLRGFDLNFIGLRDYVVPRPGHVFVARDYSQQEIRILAHYEDGELLSAYLKNPELDVHEYIRQLIKQRVHILYPRKFIKIVVFAIIYGRGNKNLAAQLNTDLDEAISIKGALFDVVPGIKWLNDELKEMCRNEQPMYTWGGRRYYAEEDSWIKVNGSYQRKRWWYKMINLLIQGSAADATKVGMVNVDDVIDHDRTNVLIQIHDELLFEIEKSAFKKQNALIKDAMEDLDFDVPMLTDAKTGALSWGRLTKKIK